MSGFADPLGVHAVLAGLSDAELAAINAATSSEDVVTWRAVGEEQRARSATRLFALTAAVPGFADEHLADDRPDLNDGVLWAKYVAAVSDRLARDLRELTDLVIDAPQPLVAREVVAQIVQIVVDLPLEVRDQRRALSGILRVGLATVDGVFAVHGHDSSSLVDGQEPNTPGAVGNTVEDSPDMASLGLGGSAEAEPPSSASALASADRERSPFPTPTAKGLYLRPEFSELTDYRPERVDGVSEAAREKPDGVRVALDAEPLDGAALAVEGGDNSFELRTSYSNVVFGHESSPEVAGPVLETPDVPATTVGGTPDTSSGVGEGVRAAAVGESASARTHCDYLVSPAWVEATLGISRPTRLDLESRGVLEAVRLTPTSHRRYRRAQVEALAAGEHPLNPVDDPAPHAAVDGPQVGEATPLASPTPSLEEATRG